jgi:hypothetical protein
VTVFIVYGIDFPGEQIDAVFSSRELAEDYVRRVTPLSEVVQYRIDEWLIDEVARHAEAQHVN